MGLALLGSISAFSLWAAVNPSFFTIREFAGKQNQGNVRFGMKLGMALCIALGAGLWLGYGKQGKWPAILTALTGVGLYGGYEYTLRQTHVNNPTNKSIAYQGQEGFGSGGAGGSGGPGHPGGAGGIEGGGDTSMSFGEGGGYYYDDGYAQGGGGGSQTAAQMIGIPDIPGVRYGPGGRGGSGDEPGQAGGGVAGGQGGASGAQGGAGGVGVGDGPRTQSFGGGQNWNFFGGGYGDDDGGWLDSFFARLAGGVF